jgi:hypothetical protein
MYALINSFPAKPKPTRVALAGPCPHQPWDAGARTNLTTTLAERRVR